MTTTKKKKKKKNDDDMITEVISYEVNKKRSLIIQKCRDIFLSYPIENDLMNHSTIVTFSKVCLRSMSSHIDSLCKCSACLRWTMFIVNKTAINNARCVRRLNSERFVFKSNDVVFIDHIMDICFLSFHISMFKHRATSSSV
jgi:hypothetical protein